MFRSKDAVAAGVSWRDLCAMRDRGEILELSRGLYQFADIAGTGNLDFVAVCGRAPHGMICLDSALAYWDLSDEIPSQVHLAVPEGTHRPAIDYDSGACFPGFDLRAGPRVSDRGAWRAVLDQRSRAQRGGHLPAAAPRR